MNKSLLWIGAAAVLVIGEIGALTCGAVLGAFAHTLAVGVVILAAGATVDLVRHVVLAKRYPNGGQSKK